MNSTGFSVATGVLCLWAGTCGAVQPVGQGSIAFYGSIVESGCATNARSGALMELNRCAQVNRGNRLEVRSVDSVSGATGAHVLLVADSGSGRYYDQQYLLVDSLGKPIRSGAYIITVTAP